jgi:hypothetical protein
MTGRTSDAVEVAPTPEDRVEQLAGELANLRAEHATLRAEHEELRAGRRRRRNHRRPSDDTTGTLSRRRLFGLLGGAAAAGAGLAVAGSALSADPADATMGPMMFGQSNDAGMDPTSLASSDTANTLDVRNSGSGRAITASTSSGSGIGFAVAASTGVSPMRLLGSAASAGPPTSGVRNVGELYQDANGALFYCTAFGVSGGTWANLSTGERLVTLSTPARVYDSRNGQQPLTGPKSQITNGATVSIDVTGAKAGGGSSGVPSGAAAVLGNITMVNGPNTTFLTVFAAGTTAPSTSNINALGGQIIANNFTSQIGRGGANSNKISIQCGFGPTDFIIDIFGYYP